MQLTKEREHLGKQIRKIIGDPTGKCYHASCAFYDLAGGKEAGYKAFRSTHNGESHWWIQKGNEIIDLTADQFDFEWPYHEGKGAGFYPNRSLLTRLIISEITKG